MSRYSTAQTDPVQPTLEGDDEFTNVNEKLTPDELQSGQLHRSINKRLLDKVAADRLGCVTPVFANAIAFGSILGSGRFSNPNGRDSILIATPNLVYQISDGTFPSPVAIPNDQTLDTPCEFVQAFDKVVLFRGFDRIPLEWDGVSAAGFAQITESTPDDTTKHLIPNAETGAVFKNRLLVPIDRDQVDVSDVLNYTQFDPILENWRINMGTADKLVRIFPYTGAYVVMFKELVTLVLGNFTDPQHPEAASLEELNSQLGLAARWGAVIVGGDIQFMTNPGGIYSITQVLQNRIVAQPVAISDPIKPVIDRINWQAAAGICAAVLGDYVYWAVPLDGSTFNNAILVYNSATAKWESAPDVYRGGDVVNGADLVHFDRLHVMRYQGTQTLWAIDNFNKRILAMHVPGALTDQIGTTNYEIGSLMESRGYSTLGWNAATNRDSRRVETAWATWRPSISVTWFSEKTSDERPLNASPITKDRTKYDIFGRADYDPSNVNQDFYLPARLDYSVQPGAGVTGPITPGLKQESPYRFSVKARSRWVGIRIQNQQGNCDVMGILLETAGTQREQRRAA